jgi:hypothetical protein
MVKRKEIPEYIAALFYPADTLQMHSFFVDTKKLSKTLSQNPFPSNFHHQIRDVFLWDKIRCSD